MVDQEKLKQFLQLVQEAAQNDKLINVAVESAEEGDYSDYSFNLYDLPLDFLQRVSSSWSSLRRPIKLDYQ